MAEKGNAANVDRLAQAAPPSSEFYSVFTLLRDLGRQLEYGERVAVRIAELEVSAGRNGDVLLAVDLIADGWRVNAGAKVVAPHEFTRRRVEGVEPTIAFAHEDEIPRGRESPTDE